MTEDIITRMYKILESPPASDIAVQFEQECTGDPALLQTWRDFLAEQYLQGNLSSEWKAAIIDKPEIQAQITFQQQIQKGIRVLKRNALKDDIRHYLPKRNIESQGEHRGIRPLVLVLSVAAIGLLCIGVFLLPLLRQDHRGDIAQKDASSGLDSIAEIPVLMVDNFEMIDVSDERVVHGIPQRLPVKLSAIEGVHPVTNFALKRVMNRVPEREIAGELNATHRVSGSIRKNGDDLKIMVRLVSVNDNATLWSREFTSTMTPKAFDDVQDRISLGISYALNVNVSPSATQRLTRDITENAEAMSLFLDGERAWYERTKESLTMSIALFKQALQIDTSSIIIRGYLALAYQIFADKGFGPEAFQDSALTEATKTLLVDTLSPEALLVLGYQAFLKEKDYAKAEQLLTKALNVHPSDARIHQALAELYLRTGDMEIGREHIAAARAIEPEFNAVRWIETKYLTAFGRLEEARRAAEDLMSIDPDYEPIQNFFWIYYLSKQEYQLALDSIPTEREAKHQNYMKAITFIDKGDDVAFDSIYQKLPDNYKPSMDLLRFVADNQWEVARDLIDEYNKEDRFDLIAIFQTSDFAIFNKMKQDPGIRQILAKHGIKVHIIPKDPELEM